MMIAVLMSAVQSPPLQNNAEMQFHCMQRFLGADPSMEVSEWLQGLGLQKAQTNAFDVCSWKGIACEGKRMSSIIWRDDVQHSYYDLKWLPNLCETWVQNQSVEPCPINTRMLPGRMISFSFVNCNLIGPLELSGLPHRTTTFIVRRNMLVGIIDLTRLPEKISSIDLSYNFFSEVRVVSSKLPKSLVEVLVGKAKPNWLDGCTDKRIRTSLYGPM
mmetsp:Transcript_20818/g.32488  ORF Transcript_20818/g.32488 Transcript_20818/m.32488 type:complete len:216 (-) Transcript_20818:24-671(-)